MLKCLECGEVFENEKTQKWKEHGEKMEGCPYCGGAYEEVFKCPNCGEYATDTQGDLCDECKLDTTKRLRTFLHNKVTVAELEFLKKKYDVDF